MKYLKTLLFFAFLLVFVSQPRASPPNGGVAVTWHYDASKKAVILHLQNATNKDITGYALSVTIKHSDGEADISETSADFLPLIAGIASNQVRQNGNGSFAAGTGIDKDIPQTKDVTNVIAVMETVLYLDGTADVLDRAEFNHMVAVRKAMLLATQQANQAIIQALSAADPKTAAVGELKRLADVAKQGSKGSRDDPNSYTEMFLRHRISEVGTADDLAELARTNEARLAVIAPHTQLKEVK